MKRTKTFTASNKIYCLKTYRLIFCRLCITFCVHDKNASQFVMRTEVVRFLGLNVFSQQSILVLVPVPLILCSKARARIIVVYSFSHEFIVNKLRPFSSVKTNSTVANVRKGLK